MCKKCSCFLLPSLKQTFLHNNVENGYTVMNKQVCWVVVLVTLISHHIIWVTSSGRRDALVWSLSCWMQSLFILMRDLYSRDRLFELHEVNAVKWRNFYEHVISTIHTDRKIFKILYVFCLMCVISHFGYLKGRYFFFRNCAV